ncbi:MAG: M60 family metallopeptidase [Prevotellaceae bacterium]|jgi:hypothetical protein|nr:M60 family metallopeptidase [Prevotellaceae bacterium]
MLKNITYILLSACMLQACGSDDDPLTATSLEVSPETIDFGHTGETKAVKVSANAEWSYAVSEADGSWCSASAEGDVLSVSVSANEGDDVRETFVDVSAGKQRKRIAVRQLGRSYSILVSPSRFSSLSSIGADISVTVTANVKFSVAGLPLWMSETEVDTTPDLRVTTYRYRVAPNNLPAQRSATLTFSAAPPNSASTATLTITQQGHSAETGIAGDVKITVSSAEASSVQSASEGIDKSYDGDYTTMYHSLYSGVTYPITLTYQLSDAEVLDYLLYYPRSGGNTNGIFKEVELQVKYKESASFEKLKDVDFKGSGNVTRVNFEPALEKVAAVRFVVKSSQSDAGKAFASCAEMEFYKKSLSSFDPLTLFSDRSCSVLKSGVTAEVIEACSHPFFKNIAYSLYENTYPREFRIEEYRAYPDPAEDASVNKTGKYSKYDNPTGIYVSEGEELIVLAEGVEDGYPVSIKIQDVDGEAAQGSYFDRGASYSISNGVNKIKVANKGLAYVMYFRPDYLTASKLKLHFATGKVNGYFDLQKHATTEQWTRLLNAASFKFFDVVGRNAHLTFPTESFRRYTKDRGVELITLYDKLVYLEWKFMGLLPEPDGYGNTTHSRIFRNRMYFVVMYNSYMNATDYRTAYNASTLSELLDVGKMLNEQGNNRDIVWGPAHEVGHINQTRPTFKWHGMTEVTNNLHSIYVQTNIHNNYTPKVNTRLQMESMRGEGGFVNRYEKAMNLYFTSGIPHNKPEEDVFCKLVPFWQLHLYLTEVKGKLGKGDNSFYADLYQEARKDNAVRTNGGHQLKFVERVCELAQLNLEDFFKLYGFLTPIDVTMDDYGKEAVQVTQAQIDATLTNIRQHLKPLGAKEFQYVTDENVEAYRQGAGIVAYELREGSEAGALKRIYLNTKKPEVLNVSTIAVPSGQKLYSVDVNGTRTFIR